MKAFIKRVTDATGVPQITSGDGLVADNGTDLICVDVVLFVRGDGPAAQRITVVLEKSGVGGVTAQVDLPPGAIVAVPLSMIVTPGEDNALEYDVDVTGSPVDSGGRATCMFGSFIKVTWPYEAP